MPIKEIECQTLIRKITSQDTLFSGCYTLDPYQNCAFACPYCDSSYDPIVYVKSNAIVVLENELKKIKPARVIVGSVHDPYQPIEKSTKLTRKILDTLTNAGFPIHVLTKSPLILRDSDILKKNPQNLVTISIISMNSQMVSLFEPKAPSTIDRYKIIPYLYNKNIYAGIAVLPIFPYITDNELESLISTAAQYNAQYLLYKYLELKGDQKQDILRSIQHHFPQFLEKYNQEYDQRFTPSLTYQKQLHKKMDQLTQKYQIPTEIPLLNNSI